MQEAKKAPLFPIYWVPQRVGSDLRGLIFSGANLRFQFIGFPSGWGGLGLLPHPIGEEEGQFPIYWVPQRVGSPSPYVKGELVYYQFPIYWVPQRVGRVAHRIMRRWVESFQFIGFPSEWGALEVKTMYTTIPIVSNLLGSPASGEINLPLLLVNFHPVSNLLGSPASGEVKFFSFGGSV